MAGATTLGTTTHTTQTGYYIKVGNLVTVNFTVSWSAATGTGNMDVYGLPYTVGASNVGYGTVYSASLAIADAAPGIPQSGQVRIRINKAISGTGTLTGIISYTV